MKTLNKSVLRITAFLTVLLLLAGLFSMLRWVVLLLCIDAFIRGFAAPARSPLHRAARAQANILRRSETPVDAAPHRFAAKAAAIIYALIAALAFAGLNATADGLAQLMVLVAGLEAFAGISLGAKLYDRLRRDSGDDTCKL